jgi:hypothetical protein
MDISKTKANKFADPDCQDGCDGTGWILVEYAPDDLREEYCICAKTNMAEYEAEMREEE